MHTKPSGFGRFGIGLVGLVKGLTPLNDLCNTYVIMYALLSLLLGYIKIRGQSFYQSYQAYTKPTKTIRFGMHSPFTKPYTIQGLYTIVILPYLIQFCNCAMKSLSNLPCYKFLLFEHPWHAHCLIIVHEELWEYRFVFKLSNPGSMQHNQLMEPEMVINFS